jgi:hypothetical protein
MQALSLGFYEDEQVEMKFVEYEIIQIRHVLKRKWFS